MYGRVVAPVADPVRTDKAFLQTEAENAPAYRESLFLGLVATPASSRADWSCEGEDFEQTCSLQLAPGLVLHASSDQITETEDVPGYHLVGDIVVETPLDEFVLFGSDFYVERLDPEDSVLPLGAYGIAEPAIGELPLLGDIFSAAPRAALGLVSRDTLRALLEKEGDDPLPLTENPSEEDPDVLEEPGYFFFHFESGLGLDLHLAEILGLNTEEGAHDPFQYSIPGDQSITLIFDPLDPYFYITKDARELAAATAKGIRKRIEEARERRENKDTSDRNANPGEGGDSESRDGQDDVAANGNDSSKSEGSESTDSGSNGADGSDGDKKKETDGEKSKLPFDINAIAFSWKGGIPFVPQTTSGLPEDVEVGAFWGNTYVEGKVPLYHGINIEGPVVTSVGADGWEQAGNGDVQLDIPLLGDIVQLKFPLGEASAGYKVGPERSYAYFTGTLDPDDSFLPSWIPLRPSVEAHIAGYIDSDRPEDSVLWAKGRYSVGAGVLGDLTGLDLDELYATEAELKIDRHGVFVYGRTAYSLHPDLVFGSEVIVEAFFAFERPEESYIELTGDLAIGGEALGANARARLDRHGLVVEGFLLTPVTTIGLHGEITVSGPVLEGFAQVNLGLDGVSDALDAAEREVAKARAELEKLGGPMDSMRDIIDGERELHATKVAQARAAVETARGSVASLQSKIDANKRKIAQRKREISKKRSWAKRQKWYKKTWAWAKYAAYASWRTGDIAARGVAIGGLEASKAVANGALIVARETLKLVEGAIDGFPVELDPRMVPLVATYEGGRLLLLGTEEALGGIPRLEGDFLAEIAVRLDISGLHGDVTAEYEGRELVGGHVTFGLDPSACLVIPVVGEVCAPF